MKKYDNYKDSGVDWIGEIPSHWGIGKIKYSDLVIMGQSPLSDECNSDGVGLPFLQGNAEFGVINPIPKLYCDTANKTAESNDVLLSVRAPVGAINIANQKVGIGRGLCAIRPLVSQSKFIYYWLIKSTEELDSISTGSTFKAINLDDVKSLTFPLIDLTEQTIIANFLDHKTTQIDDLIAKKERLIQLLEEERTAIINQAVTKGLDTTVPMKDSGIEWLGEIPEHWEVILFKRVISKIKDGTHGTFQRLSEGYPFFSAKNVYNEGLKISDTESLISENDYLEITKNGFPKKNDLLITCVGTIGRTFVYDLEEPAAFQRSVTFIRFNENINPHYYKFYVQSSIYQNLLISLAKTSAQSGIYMNDLMNTYAIKIPLNEQNKIVEFLKKKTSEIDEIILKSQQEIELLKEYKTALISEVVTGKVDVRNEKLN